MTEQDPREGLKPTLQRIEDLIDSTDKRRQETPDPSMATYYLGESNGLKIARAIVLEASDSSPTALKRLRNPRDFGQEFENYVKRHQGYLTKSVQPSFISRINALQSQAFKLEIVMEKIHARIKELGSVRRETWRDESQRKAELRWLAEIYTGVAQPKMMKVGRFYKLTPLGQKITDLINQGQSVEQAVSAALQEGRASAKEGS